MARAIAERLTHELTSIRAELKDSLATVRDTDLGYSPREGMKSYRELLVEIGAMQAETMLFLTTGLVPKWQTCEAMVDGEGLSEITDKLDRVLRELIEYLGERSDGELRGTMVIPPDWQQFFGADRLEREELVRWVARHEYYHLGQVITYRWIQGQNPYASSKS